MAVKSILEVDVKDEEFVRFRAMFAEYQKELAATPGLWDAANNQMSGAMKAFAEIAGAMKVQSGTISELIGKQAAYAAAIEKSSHAWTGMSHATRRVSENIYSATTSLLRWASAGGALSGLLGAAGLFGLDRVAGEVGSARRSAQGVGATIGEQTAFKTVFDRYVDSDELVGGINQALTDPRKQFSLIGLGAKQEDIDSGDAVRVAAGVLPNLKKIADETNPAFYAIELEKRRAQGIVSVETLRRLRALQPGEMDAGEKQFNVLRSTANIDDRDAKAWQDFSVQMATVGKTLEADLKNGIIEGFKWLGIVPKGGDAKKDIAAGAAPPKDGPALAGDLATNASNWWKTGRGPPMKPGESYWGYAYRNSELGKFGNNNPGNLRPPSGIGFMRYPDEETGVKAMAFQLKRDIDVHHQQTLRQILSGNDEWPGYTHTKQDIPAYLKAVEARVGIKPDEPLKSDDATISKLVAAMAKQETRTSIAPAAVITIMNNTGGNAIITTGQLPQ